MDVTSLKGTVTYTSLEFCIKTRRVHVSSKTFLLTMFKLHTNLLMSSSNKRNDYKEKPCEGEQH